MGKFVDLTGQKFGRLTVVERAENKGKRTAWLCKCDCGNYLKVKGSSLKNGYTKSCGCLKKEMILLRNTTHGESKTRLYRIWNKMKQRTMNPKSSRYHYYGEKGIKVCEEWLNYETFRDWSLKNGYNDSLTLDRIDVNGDYCPENCHWVDWETQQNNKSNNRMITYNGETKTLAQWAHSANMIPQALATRIKLGWSMEKALTTPVKKYRPRNTKRG